MTRLANFLYILLEQTSSPKESGEDFDVENKIINSAKRDLLSYLESDSYKRRIGTELWKNADDPEVLDVVGTRKARLNSVVIKTVYQLCEKKDDWSYIDEDPLSSQGVFIDDLGKEKVWVKTSKDAEVTEPELGVVYIVDLFQHPDIKMRVGEGENKRKLTDDHKILLMKNVLYHELWWHGITDGNLWLTEWAISRLTKEWNTYSEWSEYFANPSEQQSYFMSIRWLLFQTGIIASLWDEVYERHIDELLRRKDEDQKFNDKYYPLIGELNRLYELYPDKQNTFFKLINTIAFHEELDKLKKDVIV